VYVMWIFIPVVAGLIAGCGLYWFRCRAPFYYGLSEIAAAVVLLVLIFYPETSYLLLEEDSPFFTGVIEMWFGSFAAIYLVVHGLSNMEKDLPHKWRDAWRRAFHPDLPERN
jgi:hypothetical protein